MREAHKVMALARRAQATTWPASNPCLRARPCSSTFAAASSTSRASDRRSGSPADDFARLRALLGEREQALSDLERAADERSPRLLPYLNDPAFDALRTERALPGPPATGPRPALRRCIDGAPLGRRRRSLIVHLRSQLARRADTSALTWKRLAAVVLLARASGDAAARLCSSWPSAPMAAAGSERRRRPLSGASTPLPSAAPPLRPVASIPLSGIGGVGSGRSGRLALGHALRVEPSLAGGSAHRRGDRRRRGRRERRAASPRSRSSSGSATTPTGPSTRG